MDQHAILYSFPACNSSRRVRSWLDTNKIKYVEKKVLREPLNKDEILSILRLTDEGFDDIISTKNSNYYDIEQKIDDLNINQLIELICQDPRILKKPLLIINNKLMVGWNKDKFREMSSYYQKSK